MADKVYPVTHTGFTAELLRRSRRHAVTSVVIRDSVPFSYSGSLATSTSPPWTPIDDVTVFEVRALLGTAGSTSTVITVYVNGSSIGTVTLASTVRNNSASLSAALSADTDLVTVGITTVGTGAKDLTVLVRSA